MKKSSFLNWWFPGPLQESQDPRENLVEIKGAQPVEGLDHQRQFVRAIVGAGWYQRQKKENSPAKKKKNNRQKKSESFQKGWCMFRKCQKRTKKK